VTLMPRAFLDQIVVEAGMQPCDQMRKESSNMWLPAYAIRPGADRAFVRVMVRMAFGVEDGAELRRIDVARDYTDNIPVRPACHGGPRRAPPLGNDVMPPPGDESPR